MSERDITIGYTNYRGEYRQRRIRPLTIWFGATEWHEGKQWFLSALDLEKGSARYFALKDVEFPSALDATEAEARENVARWMIAHSFSTGHGDTLVDLLDELSWQVREWLDRMLATEARLKVLEEALRQVADARMPGEARRIARAALASKEEGGR